MIEHANILQTYFISGITAEPVLNLDEESKVICLKPTLFHLKLIMYIYIYVYIIQRDRICVNYTDATHIMMQILFVQIISQERNASIACEKNTFVVTLASGQGNRFSESALNYTSLRNRVFRQVLKSFQ